MCRFRAPPSRSTPPARNCRSGLGSSPLPRRIAVLAWDRRQSRTELLFCPGIGGSLARNCRSGLGSAAVSHGIAVLAWDRCHSRTEWLLWPRGGAQKLRGRLPRRLVRTLPQAPRGIPCHLAFGAERGAPGSGKFRRFLNPKGVRAGWVVGSDARLHADTHFVTILNSDMPPPLSTLWRGGAISDARPRPRERPKP